MDHRRHSKNIHALLIKNTKKPQVVARTQKSRVEMLGPAECNPRRYLRIILISTEPPRITDPRVQKNKLRLAG